MAHKHIWTIGHSTHTLEKFVAMLHSFEIEKVIDVRRYPGSKRYPQFNKDALSMSLPAHTISYHPMPDLGGRRKVRPDSDNTAWRVAAFQGYADYMETPTFKEALDRLEHLGSRQRVAYMCSEAVWWSCHRSLISDALKYRGWTVTHIMEIGKGQEHPYTSPARIVAGELVYSPA